MKISFYDTFIVQNFKDSHFSPNNYKGIILKNEGQNHPVFGYLNTFP